MINKYFFLILMLLLLNSCQTIQDGLAGNKNKNSDEFLIEKKNRLEIPPDFGILPEPNKNKDVVNQAEKIDEHIEKLFQSQKSTEKARSKDNSAEDFVLKQIKN